MVSPLHYAKNCATKFFAIPLRFQICVDCQQKHLNTSLLMAEILCSKGFGVSEVLAKLLT